MKEAGLAILIATLALGGFLYVTSGRERSKDRDFDEPTQISSTKRARDMSGQMLDLEGAEGEGVFSPQTDIATIDGAQVPYMSILLWCGKFRSEGGGLYQFADVRAVFNPKPKVPEDLRGLASVPEDMDTSAFGDHLTQLLQAGHAGLLAATADFRGGRDLQTAEAVTFRGGVQAFVPVRSPDLGVLKASTDHLDLDLRTRGYDKALATTDGLVQVESEAARMRGQGLQLDLKASTFELKKEISGELKEVSLIGLKGEPLIFSAAGPLNFASQPEGDRPKDHIKGSEMTLLGDVALNQGSSSARGDRLTVRSGADGKVSFFEIAGRVSLAVPEGTFEGDLLTWEVLPDGRVRVTLQGTQLLATLREGTRMLPGAKTKEDLRIATSGTLTFDDITESGGAPRLLTFPEPIRLSSSDSEVAAQSAKITLREVTAFVADSDVAKKETFPSRIELAGEVRGHSPLGTFEASALDYERTYDSSGSALRDRITLSGNPQFLWRAVTLASKSPGGAPVNTNFLSQDSSMLVSSTQTLELELDPLRIEETRAKALGAVVVRSLSTDTDPIERGRISADSMELRIAEEWRAEVDDVGMTKRFVSRREVRWAEALGQVHFSDRDRLRGEGDQLTYEQAESKLVLRREGDLALFELKDRNGKIQRMQANDLTFLEVAGELLAEGNAQGALFLPPLGYGKDRVRDPIATDVQGPIFRAKLAKGTGESESEDWKIQEIRAESGMLLTQTSGSRLQCSELIGNLLLNEILIRGHPAELVITQRVGEQDLPERIVSPSLSLTDGQVLVQGPLEATFFARRRDLATAMPGGTSPKDEAIPMFLTARQDLVLADNRLSVRGAATLSQGNPGVDGFKLSGERFTLTLEGPPPPVAGAPAGQNALGSLRVLHAIAMDSVSFLSRDLTGEGDVMEFDLNRKTVGLFRYRNEGNATLTWRGQWQSPFPRFNVDYSRPDHPILSTSRTVPERDHR